MRGVRLVIHSQIWGESGGGGRACLGLGLGHLSAGGQILLEADKHLHSRPCACVWRCSVGWAGHNKNPHMALLAQRDVG
jgi:hypothetical protein